MTTNERQVNITNFGYTTHGACMFCGQSNSDGLKLEFTAEIDGSVSADCQCDEKFTGYQERMHGGMVSSLLDSAMTNCLAGLGLTAVTAELLVRFKKPIQIGLPIKIRAWVASQASVLYYMQSEIIQDGKVKATGKAKFVNQEQLAKVEELLWP